MAYQNTSSSDIKITEKRASRTAQLAEFDRGFGVVVGGCDEVGRGPLAGPLVCAACVMPLDNIILGIDDSKKLSEPLRESLYEVIIKSAISYCVSIVDNNKIDEINILAATKLGMAQAIGGLVLPELMLVDAVELSAPCKTKPIIKGDAKSYNIAAASVIAKVTRDRLMRQADSRYPCYGFARNKGYGTAEHIAALKANGQCDIHRVTFIKNFMAEIDAGRTGI